MGIESYSLSKYPISSNVIGNSITLDGSDTILSNIPINGKYYWEFKIKNSLSSNGLMIGISELRTNLDVSYYNYPNTSWYSEGGQYYKNGTGVGVSIAYVNNDIVGVAVNSTTKEISFFKNGVLVKTDTYSFENPYIALTSTYNAGTKVTLDFINEKSKMMFLPNGYNAVNKILILSDIEILSIEEGFSLDAVPKMISATANGITVYESSFSSTNFGWAVFNDSNNNSTGDFWNTASGVKSGWIKIDFNTPLYSINKYTITSPPFTLPTSQNRSPKNWTFEGSNTGSFAGEQVVLDTVTNFTDWGQNVKREFFFPNTVKFRYYRINITENNGDADSVSIGEMELISIEAEKLKYISNQSEQNFINHGLDKPFELDMSTVFTQREIINADGTSTVIETEPFTLADELEGKQVSILEYTDNPSQVESVVETETEPYSIYDEFGDTMEVLYYTDDPDKASANLEITANYSPLDEIDGDFEVVTWTDEDPAERILSLTALPKPQFIKQIDFNDVYGTITEFLTTESFSGTGNGVIRYLLSPDRTTWKTWTGSTFANIDVSNMSNIVANGIKKSILQSLTSSDWSKWIGQKLYLGIYLEEDIRDKTKAHIDSISYSDSVPRESTQISDAKLYILNTVSTINVSFAGSTLSGSIDDEDEGKVQYRVLLNDATYFPADGSFTPLMASPLDISLTIANKDVNIDENNTLRVEFKDYWGTVDYWQRNFVGSYSGLLFTDSTGEYYTTDIGEVLQYLDFGVIIAGQTTIEHEIILKNTYGYSVNDIKLYAKEGSFPSGMRAQFGTNLISFEALDVLSIEGVLHDGEEIPFYFRLSTQLGVTPPTVGEFDIVVVANKADEIEQ